MSSSSLLHKRPDISYRSIGTFFSFIQFLTVNTFVNSYRKSKVAFPQQLHSYFNLDHQTRFIMAPLGNFLSVKRYTLHRFMQFRLSVYMCVCVCVYLHLLSTAGFHSGKTMSHLSPPHRQFLHLLPQQPQQQQHTHAHTKLSLFSSYIC